MSNIIVDKTFRFAQSIITVYLDLREKGHFKLAEQLVKSGTSIGANVEEAQAAHSKMISSPNSQFQIRKQEKLGIG